MNSINLEEYSTHFPTDVGDSVRINHCKGGSTKRKFYLTRKANGVVGYCHHCGGKGFYSGQQSPFELQAPTKTRKSKKKVWTPAEWDEYQSVPFRKLSKEIRVWWFKAGLNVSEYNSIGARVKDSSSLSLPLRDLSSRQWGDVSGIATRTFKEGYPKWMLSGKKTVFPFTQTNYPAKLLVITEDYLSALRCSRFGYALPLMGTNLSNQNYTDIHCDLPWRDGRVMVWLDNDSPTVIDKAKEIQKKLVNTQKCGIILLTREAKHYINQKDLREVLNV